MLPWEMHYICFLDDIRCDGTLQARVTLLISLLLWKHFFHPEKCVTTAYIKILSHTKVIDAYLKEKNI